MSRDLLKLRPPLTNQRERGTSITPAYEGWFTNPYGSFSVLLGYAVAGSRIG